MTLLRREHTDHAGSGDDVLARAPQRPSASDTLAYDSSGTHATIRRALCCAVATLMGTEGFNHCSFLKVLA